MMEEERIAIGIDLGGTNIKGVLVNETGDVLHSLTAETAGSTPWKEEVMKMISALKTISADVKHIGIAAPGLSNSLNSLIAFMPGRLQELQGLDWSLYLQENVIVLNDAHAALIAESRLGAGKGIKNLLMVTLGTGVGGALLIDGKLHQGFLQRAGHVGHICLDSEGSPGILDIPGTLEEAFGNVTVFKRSYGKFDSALSLVEAYKAGDTLATYLWLTAVRKLSLALCSLINIVSPELIILGGGIAKAKTALTEPLETFMQLYEWQPGGEKTPIVLSGFNDFSGAIGAALHTLTYKIT